MNPETTETVTRIEGEPEPNFVGELTRVINSYSMENDSNTPDFILAEYMRDCLLAFDKAVTQRRTYNG